MKVKIVTDHGIDRNFKEFRKIVRLNSAWESFLLKLPAGKALRELFWGLHLWRVTRFAYNDVPVITAGSGRGFVFAFIQFMLIPLFRPVTHVMVDLLLDDPRQGFYGLVEKVKTLVFNRTVTFAAIWGKDDVRLYSEAFNLDRSRLQFFPFHVTTENYSYTIRDDGYVFSGGNGGRDYLSLISALGNSPYKVIIATTIEEIWQEAQPYPNISAIGVTPQRFRELMAGARLVVETHRADFFRTAGHQTFLNAMRMGKPVVIAGERSAIGYIKDEKNGLVVPAGDPDAIRSAVDRMMTNESLRIRLAEEGYRFSKRAIFDTLRNMQEIYNLAIAKHNMNRSGITPIKRIGLY